MPSRRRWRFRLPILLALLLLAPPAVAAPSRASDAIDLRSLAQALDATRCPATRVDEIARLPDRCFVSFGDVPESASMTYVTPAAVTYRVQLPPEIRGGFGWMLHLSFMVARGTLSDVSPAGIVRSRVPIGMEIPVAQRAEHTYDDRVPLPQTVRAGDTLVIEMNVMKTAFAPFELRTAASLDAADDADAHDYYAPMAFLGGMLLAMALFNLLLYAMLRQPSYLLYSLAMLAMIAFQTIQSGVAWTAVWPQLGVRDDAPAYIAYVIYFALVTAFTRSFLDLPRVAPWTDRIVLLALGALALDAVLYVGFPGFVAVSHMWSFLDPICVLFMIVTLLAAGFVAWFNDVVSARYYVIGFAGAAIGLFVAEAADYGLLKLPVWDDLCSATGVAWEAIFLAFALADRIRLAERETARLAVYAYRDQLTDIPNRRSFDDALENEWRRGVRTARPLSLLLFDIDRFKAYNDRFGHQQGDAALKMVAAEIERAARRPGDFAARYGGEEFGLILAETSPEGAITAAETVRLAVRALAIAFDDGLLTISAGCATLVPNESDTPGMLISFADGALYRAKADGRDRSAAAAPDRRILPAIAPSVMS